MDGAEGEVDEKTITLIKIINTITKENPSGRGDGGNGKNHTNHIPIPPIHRPSGNRHTRTHHKMETRVQGGESCIKEKRKLGGESLTDITLTDQELYVLDHGLKFASTESMD